MRIYNSDEPNEQLRRKKISETMKRKFQDIPHWTKGQPAWNRGLKRWWTNPAGFKKGMIPWNKGKKFPQVSGENNHNWKGGITPTYNRIRTSPEMREWRRQIFKRDNYICQFCGQRGGKLEADHIKPFSLYPELRFKLSNGRTLCKECHVKTPTYKRAASLLCKKGNPRYSKLPK